MGQIAKKPDTRPEVANHCLRLPLSEAFRRTKGRSDGRTYISDYRVAVSRLMVLEADNRRENAKELRRKGRNERLVTDTVYTFFFISTQFISTLRLKSLIF